MSALDICEKHVSAARERADAKKAALVAFVQAYPDVREFLSFWREAGATVTYNSVEFAIHGPINDRRMWYPATPGSHNKKVRNGKKGGKG